MVLHYEDHSIDTTPAPLPEAVLLVPAHNEHQRDEYGRALDSYAEAFSEAYTHESEYGLFVVDNGSTTAETGNIALEHGFQLLQSPVKGKGAAIRYGVTKLMDGLGNPDPTNLHIAFADADGAYQARTILSLIERTMGKADIAVAKRTTHESTKEAIHRRLAHVAIQKTLNRRLPTGVSDPNAGAMAFSGDAIGVWEESLTTGFTTPAEVLHRAYKKGLIAVEVEAIVANAEESRVRPLRDGIQLMRDVRHIRYRSSRLG